MGLSVQQYDTLFETFNRYGVAANRDEIDLLQLNITKKCNQSCIHCHVNAGPDRTEEMSIITMNRIFELLVHNQSIKTVDITGGAPELNSNFRYLVKKLKGFKLNIIDRCNLSVLLEKGQEKTAEFLAENKVTIFASLPCYIEENVNYQRGAGVFIKSIKAMKQLNQLGYGNECSGLVLNLVYNPLGAYLPGDQKELEDDYKQKLNSEYGIVFNQLFTITNMPINRYATMLKREGKYANYINLLSGAFNIKTADKLMCKKQVSVSWDGRLFDCDFNQALNIPICSNKKTIWQIDDFSEITELIAYGQHCYGCTAGCGSSCQGKLD